MARIPLAGNKGVALVDDEDAELVSGIAWYLKGRKGQTGYAKGPGYVYMHRLIMGLKHGDERQVDHINMDGLDNRRSNLRIVTRAQQMQNRPSYQGSTSKYRGVSLLRGKWRARVRIQGQDQHLGMFTSEEDAAEAAASFRAQHMPFSTT